MHAALGAIKGWFGARRGSALPVRDQVDVGGSRPVRLLAFDQTGLAGFHWTKVHHGSIGEVYVLGVAARARGTGLGAALTCEGLAHLQGQGLTDVMLYVDTSNAAAVAMYTGLGFERADCDVQFMPAS